MHSWLPSKVCLRVLDPAAQTPFDIACAVSCCLHRAFGSHVAEKVLAWIHAAAETAGAADSSEPTAAADGTEAPQDIEALLESLVSAVEPHIVDYATDKHATHVARALLVVVTGRDVLTPPGKKQRQRQRQQQGGGEEEEGQGGTGNQQQGQLKVS